MFALLLVRSEHDWPLLVSAEFVIGAGTGVYSTASLERLRLGCLIAVAVVAGCAVVIVLIEVRRAAPAVISEYETAGHEGRRAA